MQRDEIVTGRKYANAAGAVRRVLRDADSRSPRQQDRDEITYRIETGKHRGREFSCTRSAFARWAEAVVDDAPAAPSEG